MADDSSVAGAFAGLELVAVVVAAYLASGYAPVAYCRGRRHDTGKERSQRWLPGLYTPSTEVVDRVRWERGEDRHASTLRWVDGVWHDAN